MDRKELDQTKRELDQVRTENAHLHAQVAAMSEELSQKSEEIQKYHAEQAVIFSRIREMVGNPAEIINKAHLYNRIMASGEPTSAKQALPILVTCSRNDEGPSGGNPEGGCSSGLMSQRTC